MGFIIGAVLASVVTAYAASRLTLVNGDSEEIATSTNPMYVQQEV